jgi:hypothetical protein
MRKKEPLTEIINVIITKLFADDTTLYDASDNIEVLIEFKF